MLLDAVCVHLIQKMGASPVCSTSWKRRAKMDTPGAEPSWPPVRQWGRRCSSRSGTRRLHSSGSHASWPIGNGSTKQGDMGWGVAYFLARPDGAHMSGDEGNAGLHNAVSDADTVVEAFLRILGTHQQQRRPHRGRRGPRRRCSLSRQSF